MRSELITSRRQSVTPDITLRAGSRPFSIQSTQLPPTESANHSRASTAKSQTRGSPLAKNPSESFIQASPGPLIQPGDFVTDERGIVSPCESTAQTGRVSVPAITGLSSSRRDSLTQDSLGEKLPHSDVENLMLFHSPASSHSPGSDGGMNTSPTTRADSRARSQRSKSSSGGSVRTPPPISRPSTTDSLVLQVDLPRVDALNSFVSALDDPSPQSGE